MLTSLLAVYVTFGFRFVAPMLALPYLSNMLSASALATYLTVQSIGFMGGVAIEYGFGGWASRELAGAQTPDELSEIASGVLSAQGLLIAIVCPSVATVALLTPGMSASFAAVLASAAFAVVSGLTPAWYFQGRFRAPTSALIECVAAVLYLGLLLLLVHSSADLPLAFVSMVLAPAIAYGLGQLQLVRETTVRCFKARLGWAYIRSAFTMFSTRATILIYTSASTWLMFVLSDPDRTSQYGLANRLAGPILALYGPLGQVLLPYLHRRTINSGTLVLMEGLLFVALLEATAGAAIVACHLLSDFVTTQILMIPIPGVSEAVNGLSWMLLSIAASQALVLYFILPHRKESWNLRAILAGAVVFTIAAPLLVPRYAVTGMILARILGETAVAVGLLIGSIVLWRRTRVLVRRDTLQARAAFGAIRGDE
jgi:polysaccharide transporter, PST family